MGDIISIFFNPKCLLALNCIYALVVSRLLINKIIAFKNKKTVKEVLFASSASGCCSDTDFSIVNNCMNRYCFKKNLCTIVQLIDQSQHSICLALYSLHLTVVQEALANAKRRDVEIKIITTEEAMKTLSRDFMRLSTSGIPIRFPLYGTERLLHHKFCIVDGRKRDTKQSKSVIMTGSMNWTMRSFTSNWDNIIVISNDDLVEKYQNEFDSMWKNLERSRKR